MTVKRYDAMHKDVWTDESGKYVRYEDYATLKARMDMIQGLMSAAEQANQLAKESAESLVKERDALAVSAAEMQAQGVDMAIEHLIKKFELTGRIGVPVMALEWLAAELRKEAGNGQ